MNISFKPCVPVSVAVLLLASAHPGAFAGVIVGPLPQEPLEIGHEPQFLFDLHVVDSTWALREKRESVQRVFHPCHKHADNPLITGDQPGYLWVVRDADSGLFRMWYQLNIRNSDAPRGERQFRTYIAYAESRDGIRWDRPALDLVPEEKRGELPRNIVLYRQEAPSTEACTPQILEVPDRDRRGYRFLMLYRNKGPGAGKLNGIRVIGSQDGVHWDPQSDTLISRIPSDTHNTVVFDPRREEYSMYLRAKHVYSRGLDERRDDGQSRRTVARLASKELWSGWPDAPQSILAPDEIDNETRFNLFYGMPVRYFAGIHWGFLEPFRLNDNIHTELAWSRDGVNFSRLPQRPKLIEYGEDGAWDDTMVFASPGWVEVGDEWWIYYSGWDGPHETADRTGAVGLATIRKEGFISLRGPASGGVACTRTLRWPGGALFVNADAQEGELQVRVSDERRKPLEGFDYDDCEPFRGDSVAHEVKWGGKSLDALEGRVIRLEFFLRNVDLYTFKAVHR